MVRRRSYEFYEVVTNLGRADEERRSRGSLATCERVLAKYANEVAEGKNNVYLTRVTVVEAWKADK